MDSEALLQRSQAGDPGALPLLAQRHLPALRAFIRLRMGSGLRARESCSDIAQSVCLKLLRDLDDFEFRGEAPFRAWLYTAALRKIQEHGRHNRAQRRDVGREVRPAGGVDEDERRLSELYAHLHTPSREASAREQLERVEAAFDEMPDDYREVMTLARIAGLPHADIAERMGRPVGAIRMLLHRATARLATLLGRESGESE